jgi:hypothetical protein
MIEFVIIPRPAGASAQYVEPAGTLINLWQQYWRKPLGRVMLKEDDENTTD